MGASTYGMPAYPHNGKYNTHTGWPGMGARVHHMYGITKKMVRIGFEKFGG